MTRGIIVFISNDGYYYESVEFNGDMYSVNGHGQEIIEKYESGTIINPSDYIKYLTAFDQKNFGYSDEGYGLFHVCKYEDGIVDLSERFPDYFYVINHSGGSITFKTKLAVFDVENKAMTVTCFSELKSVVRIKKQKALISKKKFEKIIKNLQAAHDLTEKIDDLVCSYKEILNTDFINGMGLAVCHDELVIDLLKIIFGDKSEMIGYYIYESDYGRKFALGNVVDAYGNEIDISTPDKLYDYLMADI